MQKIRVVELFAGVGGFRLGLERASKIFETIWANQWEPSTKIQHAFDIYLKNFGSSNSINVNEDIAKVINDIPQHDLLVGGFPCQDYSVAHGNKAQGIQGKKGVLWWEIYKILQNKKPKYFLLENVDRLLNSPTKKRGRDFAIMLRTLNDLNYIVEWKAITASHYGFPQKRRRVFIFGYRSKSNAQPKISQIENSLLEKAFPSRDLFDVSLANISKKKYSNLVKLTETFDQGKFNDCGIAIKGIVIHAKYTPKNHLPQTALKNIIDNDTKNYVYLNNEQQKKAEDTKLHKKIQRISKSGFAYSYTEGKMVFPDNLEKPGRTMLTSEGTINRSSHFIKHNKKIRFLTPIEAERLNGFPEGWTEGKTPRQRFFFMGNALVVGIIEKIGKELIKTIDDR